MTVQRGCVLLCYGAAVRTEHELIQTETIQQIVALQAEMERNKERQPPPPPVALQPKSHTHVPFSLVQFMNSN